MGSLENDGFRIMSRFRRELAALGWICLTLGQLATAAPNNWSFAGLGFVL